MDVGCSLQGFGASIMTLQYHLDFATPVISPNPPQHPPAQVEQYKGAPMCPSTAYQGAKTLCIYMLWMWDVVCKALEPQPCPYCQSGIPISTSKTVAGKLASFSKNC